MIIVHGLHGIYAKIIADSISQNGIRLTSFEIQYPRIVHSEFLTHSMLARNAASSRAIPFSKMVEQLNARPVRFGANQSGMQDAGEHDAPIRITSPDGDDFEFTPEIIWEMAKKDAIYYSKALSDAGYHKQVFNRLTEPFQFMKTVATGTEWANFFWLRNHDDADPTIHELAQCMHTAFEQSEPVLLNPGEWHLPYVKMFQSVIVKDGEETLGQKGYYIGDNAIDIEVLSVEDAIKVSAARTAAVSFRNVDYTLEKSKAIFDRLVGADRKHASAFGHQCTPMQDAYEGYTHDKSVNIPYDSSTWEPGVSHMDRNEQLWSAMMRGYVQYRKLIPGENYTGKI